MEAALPSLTSSPSLRCVRLLYGVNQTDTVEGRRPNTRLRAVRRQRHCAGRRADILVQRDLHWRRSYQSRSGWSSERAPNQHEELHAWAGHSRPGPYAWWYLRDLASFVTSPFPIHAWRIANISSWMLGTDWPNNGEIDIIEGVNDQSANDMTLHTSAGCSINNGGLLGSVTTSNCDVNAPGQPTNAGCGITAQATNTYGTGFNDAGGGVYATEWTSQAISIWFFPHSAIPGDIASGNPDPTSWGTPLARFAGNCNIDSHFGPQQIVRPRRNPSHFGVLMKLLF